MVRENLLLDRVRKLRQARKIVVPVAFDTLDAQRRHDRQVLQQRHGADVAQIFTTHDQ